VARAASAEQTQRPPSTFTIDRLAAMEEGGVGWAAVDATWQVQGMEPVTTRLTFVFHREDGAWKAVLQQTAVAVPNEKIFVPVAD